VIIDHRKIQIRSITRSFIEKGKKGSDLAESREKRKTESAGAARCIEEARETRILSSHSLQYAFLHDQPGQVKGKTIQ